MIKERPVEFVQSLKCANALAIAITASRRNTDSVRTKESGRLLPRL